MADQLLHGSLSAEISDSRSPVRRFLAGRLSAGLRGVQRRYRQSVPGELAVPPRGASAGTVAVAADWLLRFLIHPAPDLDLVMAGVRGGQAARLGAYDAVIDVTRQLGMPAPLAPGPVQRFDGPIAGCAADPVLLARACWCFALLTEAYRGGTRVLRARSPLGPLRGRTVTGADLLALAPDNALRELAQLRAVMADQLLPRLASRPGPWALGPVFAGSQFLAADADLVASRLLLELKVTVHPRLAATDLWQLIAYPLLDFPDDYQIREVGLFSGRAEHLAVWDLHDLLNQLAQQPVSLPALRADFRQLIEQ